MKNILITILTIFILGECFSQNVQSSDLFIFKPKTAATTTIQFQKAYTYADSGAYLPIRDNNWTPTRTGAIQYSPTQGALYYYNADSVKWLLLGGGSGGTPPSLATLDNGYGIIGGQYDPYGVPLTWSIDTSLLATLNYVNNFFPADTIFDVNFIVDSITNTPPASPVDSSYVLVGTNPTGVFITHANQVAQRIGTGWEYTIPSLNDKLINAANDVIYVWNGTAWVATATPILNNRQPQKVNVTIQPQSGYRINLRIRGTDILVVKNDRNIYVPKYINPDDTIYTVQATFNSLTGQLDTIHARPLFAVSPLRLSNDTLYCDGCTGGGGDALANFYLKDSALSSDRTVDADSHSLEFDNLSSLSFNALNGAGIATTELGINMHYANDSSSAIVTTYGNTDVGSILNLHALSNTYEHSINIEPNLITIEGNTTNGLKTNLQINNLDSLDADPNTVMYLKSDKTVAYGHINTGGGSGSGITSLGTPTYGLTRTNDSTYEVDTTLLLTKLGAAATYQPLITTFDSTISATEGQTAFVFSTSNPSSASNAMVFVDGIKLNASQYSLSGTTTTTVTTTGGLHSVDTLTFHKTQ